jgi:manganese/iron transport system permease protein
MIEPFLDNTFMQRALFAGVLLSALAAIVGTYVVLRGLAFIGDALAHGVLPGVAIAAIVGAPVLIGAGIAAFAMIAGIGVITTRSRLSNDSAIGLLFVGLLSLGVVLVSSSRRIAGDLESILFGEFLGVDSADLLMLAISLTVAVAIVLLTSRALLVSSFDEDLAQAMGFGVKAHYFLLLGLVAGTVVVAFQAVGTLLVFGLLLAPSATGALVARRIGVMMAVATLVGIISSYIGLLASYHFEWAAGASVVLCAVSIFFLVLFGVRVRDLVLGRQA